MFVAAARITLAIPDSESPKHKRQVVGKVVERIRSKFNASACEVASLGVWQSATIGISTVSSEESTARNYMERILRAVEELYAAPIVSRAVEVIDMGASLHEDAALSQLAAKLESGFAEDIGSAADGSDGAARDAASERGGRRNAGKSPRGKGASQSADDLPWPQVKTLADVEDPDDPEAAGYRAPPKQQKGAGKKKSAKEMTPEERAAAIRAIADEMKGVKS